MNTSATYDIEPPKSKQQGGGCWISECKVRKRASNKYWKVESIVQKATHKQKGIDTWQTHLRIKMMLFFQVESVYIENELRKVFSTGRRVAFDPFTVVC